MTPHPPSRRMPELDALRGLMLIGMTLTHLPTRASTYAYQPLGFIAWAEGFILLSAVLTGRVYTRVMETGSVGTATGRLWRRAGKLYGYHLALLAIAFTVIAGIAVTMQNPAVTGLVDFYLAHRGIALVDALALIYQPALLDILPMYIVFLLVTSLCLYTGRRWGWRFVLVPSAALWLAAQFGIREAAYRWISETLPIAIPYRNLGAFDLYAWQLLWVLGLWMGSGAGASLAAKCRSRWVIGVSAAIALMLIVLRYPALNWLAHPVDQGNAYLLFDKWHLGAVRLVNLGALAALFVAFREQVGRYFLLPPLVLLGRASLEVFAAHVLVCFSAFALVGDGSTATGPQQAAILVGCFTVLYAVAYLKKRQKRSVTAAFGNWPKAEALE